MVEKSKKYNNTRRLSRDETASIIFNILSHAQCVSINIYYWFEIYTHDRPTLYRGKRGRRDLFRNSSYAVAH